MSLLFQYAQSNSHILRGIPKGRFLILFLSNKQVLTKPTILLLINKTDSLIQLKKKRFNKYVKRYFPF